MLTTVFAALLVTQGQAPTATPDWRSEFMKNPPRSSLTTEWTCSENGSTFQAAISIEDVGTKVRNQRFRVTLTSLNIDSGDVRPDLRQQVSEALTQLNNVGIFQGQCRDESPGLFITGFSYDGERYSREEFRIDLE